MMNSEFGFERAKNCRRSSLLAQSTLTTAQRLEAAYLRILDRKPDPAEDRFGAHLHRPVCTEVSGTRRWTPGKASATC